MGAEQMIIDRQMPAFDVVIAEHTVVCADPASALATADGLDFTTVHTPLLDAAMWARGLPSRLRGRRPPQPQRLALAAGDSLPGWLILGRGDTEVAFGAVGKFWKGSIEWRDVDPVDFAAFSEPGWGKIACCFSVRQYGEGRTLLSYECRTATTDSTSRRRFARYWAVVKPLVRHIMRATLDTIAQSVTRPRTPSELGAR